MATIKLSDRFGLDIAIEPDAASVFARYFNALPGLLVEGRRVNDIAALTLDDPAITSFQTGLNFSQPVPVGTNSIGLTVNSGAIGSLGIHVPNPDLPEARSDSWFGDDQFGEDVAAGQNARIVSVEFTATLEPTLSGDTSVMGFGFDAGSSVSIKNCRRFAVTPTPPTVLNAIRETLANLQLSRDIEDLTAMREGNTVALFGRGNLRFSSTASLLTVANPLATALLPSPSPEIRINQGASISIGGSFQLSGQFEIRVCKLGPHTIRLGYFRERGSELDITVDASAGLSVAWGEMDLLSRLISAISPDADADLDELRAARIDADTISAIQETIQASVQRTLEVALTFELGNMSSTREIFSYEIDLATLDASGRAAIEKALRGDLTALVDNEDMLPSGIKVTKSIFTNLRQTKHTWKFNLLGIYNFISLSKLTLEGQVLYDKVSGDLTLTDTATVSRIQTAGINVRGKPNCADSAQLRRALAASFLITATYRGGRCLITPPNLKSSQTYCELHGRTSRGTMLAELDVALGLGLTTLTEIEGLIEEADDFGRTLVYASVEDDDMLTTGLFLEGGVPRTVDEYERIGREAMQIAVRDGSLDATRLIPLKDDALWKIMKQTGQPGFRQIFKASSETQIGAIIADYSTIVWWAETMASTAESLARLQHLFRGNARPDQEGSEFRKLRAELAHHMERLAADTKDEFGRPWGLIAMDLLARNKSAAFVMYTGPRICFARERRATSTAA